MYESGSSPDLLTTAEALQKPIVLYAAEEEKLVKKKIEKGETQRISLQLFKNGKNIAEIARERELAYSTIEGHLAGFITTGEIDVFDIVDKIKLAKISELLEKNPTASPSELKQQLGDDFSYGQIKAAMNLKSSLSKFQS
jgi:uncharacterized protein YpbB